MKPYISGRFCDECPSKSYHLKKEKKPSRCADCFCNGLQIDCRPSNLFYNKINSDFEKGTEDWTVNNIYRNLTTSIIAEDNSIHYNNFGEFEGEDLFFYAPQKFLGNKVIIKKFSKVYNIKSIHILFA
jgi:hypothetical protein